jgi:S-DNA-T family DNA segregation ATPase FtsK/SpoIIIE
MLAGLVSVAVVATAGDSSGLRSRGLVTVGAFVLATLAVVVAQLHRQHRRRRLARSRTRTTYLSDLDEARRRAREAAARQWSADRVRFPAPSALPAIAEQGSRVWARDGDERGLLVRYGVRRGPLSVSLVPGPRSPREDPVAAAALDALLAVHGELPGLAAVIDLGGCTRISVVGPPGEARALARAVVCAAATSHPPTTLRIAVLADPEAEPVWDWLKWLPHALSPTAVDAAGRSRMVAADPDRLMSLLPTSRDTGPTTDPEPRLLLVLDRVAVPDERLLALHSTTTMLVSPRQRDGAPIDLVLTLRAARHGEDGPTVRVDHVGAVPEHAVADQCDLATATALARRLAGRHPDPVASRGTELSSMLGIGDLDAATYAWPRQSGRARLRVPIGTAPGGSTVELDLKEPAEHGMGPHGLVVGATGSGKSELLRTTVLGLALTHAPEQLNLVLVDFKGGATFAGLSGLPHVSAAITNLSDDLTLVDRMSDALSGEVVRREELLRRAGGFASVREYERARAGGAPLVPLPSLLVVVDELAELLAHRPDLIDVLVSVGRLGRSLGIHLLLSTQRLEEGRLRGLESHLSYRIGLRTFSADESRAVLGTPDAAELPAVPGHGLLRTSSSDLQPFTAAYVSGPRRRNDPTHPDPPVSGPLVLPWSARPVGTLTLRAASTEPAPGPEASEHPSFLDCAVARLATSRRCAHRIWLPPLDRSPTLDRLMPDLAPRPDLGLVSEEWRSCGGVSVPIGVLDRPREQRQDPLVVDLSRGHVAVVGGPGSGKTTLLRALVLGLALTMTPREHQLYAVDLAGGLATGLAGLPHLAGTASRADPDVVRRIVAEVGGILDAREEYFRCHAIDTMDAYRLLRSSGRADDGYGDVVLVVDGWGALRDLDDDLDLDLQRIASRGLRLGVHLVSASARWADLRPAARDLMSTRLELRLGDPADSEIDRRAAAAVPRDRPGRGLSGNGVHFLGALARIDGDPDRRSAGAAVASLVRRVADAWPGPAAPPLRLLPALVTTEVLLADAATAEPELLLLALDEHGLVPVGLDVRAEPHWLVLGDGGSGRSSALRTYLREVVRTRTPATAQVVVLDPRRSLLGEVPGAYLLDHVASTVRAGSVLADLTRQLEGRLPGPEVTATELRERTWWNGPEVFVVVDDHDLLATPQGSPLAPVLPLLPMARDVGLHLVVARRAAGASRTSYEPVLQRLRDLGTPGLLLSGDPDEGPLLGRVRASAAPPGRGRWVSRARETRVVQVAWCAPRS